MVTGKYLSVPAFSKVLLCTGFTGDVIVKTDSLSLFVGGNDMANETQGYNLSPNEKLSLKLTGTTDELYVFNASGNEAKISFICY